MKRKEKQAIEKNFLDELAPTELIAAKENWQQMKANKKVMRQRRNLKRA